MANTYKGDTLDLEAIRQLQIQMEMEAAKIEAASAIPNPQIQRTITATQVMAEEEYRHRLIYGGRSHGKSNLIKSYQQQSLKSLTGRWAGHINGVSQNAIIADDIRLSKEPEFAIPPSLYSGKYGALLMIDDGHFPKAPINTIQDREYLSLSIKEYNNFAEAVQTQCYLDRFGNHCKMKNAKMKKLKNIRRTIHKSQFLLNSMIWKAQLHIIEVEISRRQTSSHQR